MTHFFQHCFFFVTNILRDPNIYMNQLVTLLITIYSRESFSFQSENFSTLCSSWNFYFGSSINGGYFELCTKNCICKRNMKIKGNIHSITLQFFMWFFFYKYYQVAGCTTS